MRKGLYGKYKGKEYRIAVGRNMEVRLVTSDPKSVEEGFIPYDDLYIKDIKGYELEEAYKIITRCEYKDTEFLFMGENSENNTYTLGGDESHASKFPMEYRNRREFIMEVPKVDVKIYEVKRPYDKNEFL